MGEVYRAYDEQLGRNVALKVLPSDQLGDSTARARLLREARSAAALNHPHICTIYEVSESDGHVFIAMELVDGKTPSGPLPKAEIIRYGVQLADALAHAHDRGIVHRDLKCGNVMITSDGRLKILDFGLAMRVDSGEVGDSTTEALITKKGSVVGTLAYMAPEQLRGGIADTRSDIWALGVMLYEMATGERPFKGQTQFELVSSILNDPPPSQPVLKDVIERCLAKEPAKRYQRAAEIKATLESPTTIRRPRLWIAAAVAVVIAAAAPFIKIPHRSARIQSLAVLPLENLSGDPNQEYFADGITDALITELGKIRGLSRVIARSTVMQFKGSKEPPAQIAKELDVDALLTGSVIRSGDRVRVTAALVNPSTGAELWSGRFERDLRDVLSLQGELTRAIILEITGKLTPEEKERLQKTHTVNPAAYEDYLKGRHYLRERANPQDVAAARVYFERALKEDPDYGPAMMGLADAIASPAHAGRMPATDVFPRARALVEQTLAREPDLAEARDLNARFLFVWDWDWPAAELEFKRAIELNPNYPDAHCVYSQLLQVLGRSAESVAEARRAVELDPQNLFFRSQFGYRLVGAGKYDEAIGEFRKAANHGGISDVFFLQHRFDDAWREAQASFSRKDVADAAEAGYASGGYAGAMRAAAEATIAARAYHFANARTIARFYLHAGMTEKVFEWLKKGAEERDSQMVYLVGDPLYAEIQGDPRFAQIVATARAKAASASR